MALKGGAQAENESVGDDHDSRATVSARLNGIAAAPSITCVCPTCTAYSSSTSCTVGSSNSSDSYRQAKARRPRIDAIYYALTGASRAPASAALATTTISSRAAAIALATRAASVAASVGTSSRTSCASIGICTIPGTISTAGSAN